MKIQKTKKSDPRASPPARGVSPILRRIAPRQLEKLRVEFDRSGSSRTLMRGIFWCAACELPMPEWLAAEFLKCYIKVWNYKVASWDEAFGKPFPKGTHLAKLRKVRKYKSEVYRLVRQGSAQGKGIGKILFEEVGDELGLNATETEELYYRIKTPRKTQKFPG